MNIFDRKTTFDDIFKEKLKTKVKQSFENSFWWALMFKCI